MAEFRAAVWQNVLCLHIREAKNMLAHPTRPGSTFPLTSLASGDPRGTSTESWQKKLTGERTLTPEDLVTAMGVLYGVWPSEDTIRLFLDVAEKRQLPPPGWRWPDT